jgi:hypothetical protein
MSNSTLDHGFIGTINKEENEGLILAMKIISIILILALTIMFGFLPFF